jgi:MFS family permease
MISLLRRNRDFRTLFTAQVISYMGDWFATVAVLGLVLDLTDSGFAAAMVFVAQSLPAFFVTPLAGTVADRFDRRKVLVIASSIQAVAALGFLLVGPGRVWMAFVAQGTIAALGAFFAPASNAALPNLVDKRDLPLATALMASTWGAMLAIGAALGAVFTVVFGRDAAFIANSVSFAVAGTLIFTVRRRMREEGNEPDRTTRMRPLLDTWEALRYAWHRPQVLALLGSKAGFGFGTGVVGLLAVLAEETFNAGDGGTGLLLTMRGLGVVAGPLLANRVAKRGVHGLLLACGVASIVYGVAYGLVPFAPGIAVAAVLVLIAHLGGGCQWTFSTYGLQVVTPDALRGRIFAADFALVTMTMSLSLVLAGWMSSVVGVGPTIVGLACIEVAWGVLYLVITKTLRAPDESLIAPAAVSQ